MRDAASKGRIRGHRGGIKALKPDFVRMVRDRLKSGAQIRKLAKEVGTSRSTIWRIKHRLSWASI